MELTEEQKAIINTVYNDEPVIKINAYAGSGKTTTLVEVVKEIIKINPNSKILYLVFNRMMSQEASKKFPAPNVQCYTAHAFALRRMNMSGKVIKVLNNVDLSRECLRKKEEHPKYKYVPFKKFKMLMDNYALSRLCLKDFILLVSEDGIAGEEFKPDELEFFEIVYKSLIKEDKYTHGMYLKEYALNHHDTIRGYDYVLLDEAQDLNMFMMDIVKRIERKKLYVVGDNYQQIYAWNNAINSMQKYEGKLYPLSKSFRFNDEIREIADAILRLQESYRTSETKISNVHNNKDYDDSKVTILFRTNAAMLERALDLVYYNNEDKRIKVNFMAMINGGEANNFNDTFSEMLQFTKALLEGCYGKNSSICKEFDREFPIQITSAALKSYIKMAEKENYRSFYEYVICNLYSFSLDYIKYWKIFDMLRGDVVEAFKSVRSAALIKNYEKEYTLCTAHRSKGLEWEYVIVASDDWKITNLEEINLLYVACSRAIKKLDYLEIDNLIKSIKEQVNKEEALSGSK